MHAEAPRPRWVALLMGAVLLTTGCATLAPLPGQGGAHGPRAMSALREMAAGTPPLQAPSSLASTEPGKQERSHRPHPPPSPPTCGDQAVPSGWPDFSSDDAEALLAPFLACPSPAEFVALQDRVDMPQLVRKLDDWRAARLGSLGPMREDAAAVLNRKRTSFLLHATEKYGAANAEVLALFLLHSSYDDDLREMRFLLARDKRLEEMLKLMPAVREELEQRGLRLSDHRDRDFEWKDLGRGLARAGRDALSSSPLSNGAAGVDLSAIRGQLPPPYQQALDEVERAQMRRHFSPGSVALGSFDHLTFGVPLGFYGLVAGTGHGAYSLSQGQYEQATRELAPAALLVTLYAGGKAVRSFSEARGATGTGRGLQVTELRLRALEEVARQLEARLGVEGLRELARDIRASREAGRFVAVGGVDAALALREARGDVARAQAWLSQARPERAGPPAAKSGAGKSPGEAASVADDTAHATPKRASAGQHQGGLSSLVDKEVGLTPEVVEAKLARVELDSAGPRLPGDVAVLEKQRPSPDAPLPGAQGHPLWSEYVAYYEKRLGELKQGKAAKGPLRWEAYELMRGWFARGLAFERLMVEVLRTDATLPRAKRHILGDFDQPRLETYVGVTKPESGLRFADVLVIEEGALAGPLPRVETFSFKSRNLSLLDEQALTAQMKADASEALLYYGQTLEIRRPSLKHLVREGVKVPVHRVRLIYEGGKLKPENPATLRAAVKAAAKAVPGVEVLFR